MKFSSCK